MRKDVECTFGIMKARWRILKFPIQVHGTKAVDKIWMTCCALHNWLLEINGCNDEWTSHFNMNNNNMDDNEGTVPFAVQQLNANYSGMGPGTDLPEVPELDLNEKALCNTTGMDVIDVEGINIVRNLSLDTFCGSLIQHFDIRYKRKELVWPKQKKIISKF